MDILSFNLSKLIEFSNCTDRLREISLWISNFKYALGWTKNRLWISNFKLHLVEPTSSRPTRTI